METEQYDLVILAGGTGRVTLPGRNPEPRALAPLKGRRLLHYILQAAKDSGRIRRAVVVTHPAKVGAFRAAFPAARLVWREVTDDGSPRVAETVRRAVAAGQEFSPWPADSQVGQGLPDAAEAGTEPLPLPLYVTQCAGTMPEGGWAGMRLAQFLRWKETGAPLTGKLRVVVSMEDLPFLTGEALKDFTGRAERLDADGVYSLVTKASCLREFPDLRRTFFHLAEGDFTGGNLSLIASTVFPACVTRMAEVYAMRKNVVKLAGWLGGGIILKFLLHRLSLADVERKASETFGLKGRCVISEYASVGTDLDRPEEWAKAEKYMGKGTVSPEK